jgi:CelD/BcsL family acetyltransferase involved in cellulose biosynthesis
MRRLSFNASGEPLTDTTYVEFNSLVTEPGAEDPIVQALVRYLRKAKWDELALLGFSPGAAYHSIKTAFGDLTCEEVIHPSHYVDLALLRSSGRTYEAALTTRTRKHLRQNIRYYLDQGPVSVEAASDISTAFRMFEELGQLSKKRWTEKRRRSIFSSSRFVQFHREFISKCFNRGMVQMLRVTAGERIIGVLYNLVYLRKVYFYQCGFNYGSDRRLCPGRVALSQAIQYSLDAGHDEFDFLSGESQYKESLSTASRRLAWLTLRKTGLRPRLAKTLSRLNTTVRGTVPI